MLRGRRIEFEFEFEFEPLPACAAALRRRARRSRGPARLLAAAPQLFRGRGRKLWRSRQKTPRGRAQKLLANRKIEFEFETGSPRLTALRGPRIEFEFEPCSPRAKAFRSPTIEFEFEPMPFS